MATLKVGCRFAQQSDGEANALVDDGQRLRARLSRPSQGGRAFSGRAREAGHEPAKSRAASRRFELAIIFALVLALVLIFPFAFGPVLVIVFALELVFVFALLCELPSCWISPSKLSVGDGLVDTNGMLSNPSS